MLSPTVFKSIPWLKDLLAAGAAELGRRIGKGPEKFAEELVTHLGPVLSAIIAVAQHEKRHRGEVYRSLAHMLSDLFSTDLEDTYQWVLSEVHDPDLRPSLAKDKAIARVGGIISVPLVMRVKYQRRSGNVDYERVCEIFVNKQGKSLTRLEARKAIKWDEMPIDVQEVFLRTDQAEAAFQIFPTRGQESGSEHASSCSKPRCC